MAQLMVQATGFSFPLDLPPKAIVGRADGVEFQIDNPSVADRHCIIECREHIHYLRRLDPTAPTFVNGAAVGEIEIELSHQDEIRVGKVSLRLELSRVESAAAALRRSGPGELDAEGSFTPAPVALGRPSAQKRVSTRTPEAITAFQQPPLKGSQAGPVAVRAPGRLPMFPLGGPEEARLLSERVDDLLHPKLDPETTRRVCECIKAAGEERRPDLWVASLLSAYRRLLEADRVALLVVEGGKPPSKKGALLAGVDEVGWMRPVGADPEAEIAELREVRAVAVRAVEYESVFLSSDAANEFWFPGDAWIGSVMAIPLMRRGGPIGVLWAEANARGHFFHPELKASLIVANAIARFRELDELAAAK